jgi:hypothetical protein
LTKFDRPQLNHVLYGACTAVEVVVVVVAAAALVGMEVNEISLTKSYIASHMYSLHTTNIEDYF